MLFDCHSHFNSLNHVTILNISGVNDAYVKCFSVGIHPWESSKIEDNFLSIEHLAKGEKCIAIGEIGLDKVRGPDILIQKNVFEKQIEISEKLKLPVIIHCVKAWNELKVLKQKLNPIQVWIYHGFNKIGILEEVLESGLMISIGSSILSNVKLQMHLELIPNDKLLLETDDSQIDIFDIYKKVSEIKKISLSELEQIIEENFKRIFRKWQSGLNEQNY
jgi:TatD DNase family protein